MNQVAVEALYSATYVENYLDSVENLPDDAQKFFTRIREVDIQYRSELRHRGHIYLIANSLFFNPDYLRDAASCYEQWSNCSTSELESANASKRSRAMSRMQQSLIAARELGDEKMQLAQGLQELIDHKVRQLEHDYKNLDYGQDEIMQTDLPKDSYTFSHVASPVPNSPSAVTGGNSHAFGSGSQVFMSSMAANGGSAAMVGGNGERHSSSNSSHNGSSANGNSGYSGGGGGTAGSGSGKRARRVRTDAVDMGSSDSNLENNGKGMSSYGNSSLNLSSGGAGQNTQQQQPQQQHQGNRKGQQAVNNSGKKKKRKTRVQGAGSGAGLSTGAANTSSSSNNNNNNMSALHASSRDLRDDTPPHEDTIDPDEPTYCLCDQISFGEMILCDNDLCPIEWFHFSCVSLISKPKGKWYCPNCRGDRPNVMKNKAQFLKELERYNKEREEKT